MNVPRRLRRSLLASGLVLGVVTTACGGSGKAAPTPVAAADGTTTTTDAAGAYTACLRQHGANVQDRAPRTDTTDATGGSTPPSSRPPGSRPPGSRPSTTLPPGVDASTLQAARDACKSLMPTGGPGGPNGPGTQSPAFQAYASCLKDHGVTLPDNGGFGGVNRDDPTFKAADTICAPLRPTQPSTSSTSVPTTVKP
jgi:hypothetical protein